MQEEGIVVKGLDTPYEFHERKNWVKVRRRASHAVAVCAPLLCSA